MEDGVKRYLGIGIAAVLLATSLTFGSGASPSHGVRAGWCGGYQVYKTTTHPYWFYDPLRGYNVEVDQAIAGYRDTSFPFGSCRNWQFEMLMWGGGPGGGIYYPNLGTYPSGDPGNCSAGYTEVRAYNSTVVWSALVDDDNFCGAAAYGTGWFYSNDTGYWYHQQMIW